MRLEYCPCFGHLIIVGNRNCAHCTDLKAASLIVNAASAGSQLQPLWTVQYVTLIFKQFHFPQSPFPSLPVCQPLLPTALLFMNSPNFIITDKLFCFLMYFIVSKVIKLHHQLHTHMQDIHKAKTHNTHCSFCYLYSHDWHSCPFDRFTGLHYIFLAVPLIGFNISVLPGICFLSTIWNG